MRALKALAPWGFACVLFFGTWQALLATGAVSPQVLPSVPAVLASAVELLGSAEFHRHAQVTIQHVFLAFFIAAPAGILIGLSISESAYWSGVFKPMVFFVFSIPKTIFLPMFILAFGVGAVQKVAFGVFSTIFIVLICAFAAFDSVRTEHVRVARAYGATRMQIALRVYLPSMAPILLEAARLGMIFNVTGILLAEMYASRAGVGQLVANWGESFMLTELIAGILVVSVLAILFNESIRWVEGRLEHWRS
jgi:NitT/TauT family transport system permease protein